MRAPRGMTRERFEDAVHKARMIDNARELAAEPRGIQGSAGFRVTITCSEGELIRVSRPLP